jgi:hypothetical protein
VVCQLVALSVLSPWVHKQLTAIYYSWCTQQATCCTLSSCVDLRSWHS